MPPRRFVALAIVIFASVASAQTQERVLYFEPTLTPQGSQEIVNAIRTITETPQLTLDEARKSLTFRGTAAQVETAEWLFPLLN
jgi:hypothetical protein